MDGNHSISYDEFAKWLTKDNNKMTVMSGKFKPRIQSAKNLEMKRPSLLNSANIPPVIGN